MHHLSKKRRGRKPKSSNRIEIFLLIVAIVLISVNIKILCDIYKEITSPTEDLPRVIEPIGFHKCPKNRRDEGLYCPIYPKEQYNANESRYLSRQKE